MWDALYCVARVSQSSIHSAFLILYETFKIETKTKPFDLSVIPSELETSQIYNSFKLGS